MRKKFIYSFNSKFYEYAIKVLISVLLIWVFYIQFFGNENKDVIIQSFLKNLKNANHLYLTVVIVLMLVNWVLEVIKWDTLNESIEKLSFFKSLKAILAGLTFGIVTPHRVGELGGRVLFLRPQNRIKGIIAIGVGSFAQFIVTVLSGTIGLIVISYHKSFLPYSTTVVLFFVLIMGGLIMGAIFLKLNVFISVFESISWINKYPKFMNAINYLVEFSRKNRFKVLGISLVRYMIYSIQYVLLVKYLGLGVPFYLAISTASLVFLIQTGIPLPPVLGLLARGEIAILVWSLWGSNEAVVLCATFLLWIINLGIPAICGAIIILKENLIKNKKYEISKT